MRRIFAGVLCLIVWLAPSSALAGDGATIVLDSGVLIYINNGYEQLTQSITELNRKGGDNYMAQIKIEGSTFYINLSSVSVVCRDSCSSMTIKQPRKE